MTNSNRFSRTFATSGKPLKFKGIWLSQEELFNLDIFRGYITDNLQVRIQYQILIKIRYNADDFAMLDRQFSFYYDNYTDNLSFNSLRDTIISRLFITLDKYRLNETDILLVQILYREVFYGELERLRIDVLKSKLPKSEYTRIKKISPYFPLTFDLVYYGIPLVTTGENNTVKSVLTSGQKVNQDVHVDFIESFNKNNYLLPAGGKSPSFHLRQQFFKKNVNGIDIIIVIDRAEENKILKKAYSLTGVFLGMVEDTYLGNNSLLRAYGDYIFLIKDNNIVFSDKKINLSPIKKEFYKDKDKGNIIEDTRIGVLDLETYNVNNLAKVYALGFLTNLDNKPVLYYIDGKTLNSDKIILNCVDEMLRPKYSGTTFYAHNFGKFDVVFILKTILEYNKVEGNHPYILNIICREDVILKLSIKRVIEGRSSNINILDSYSILTDSLKNLCLKYELNLSKGEFPYKFASKDTLFYKGVTPNINYYNNSVSPEVYNSIKKDVWDFKKESLIYLSKDLTSLYQVLVKVNRTLFLDFDVKMPSCLTISKLAYEIFSKDYLTKDKPIPLISKATIHNDIKLGYYGGNTEVYRPYGENLYYYDVNSLYPYVSLNDMVGLDCHKQEYINKKADLNELFGFFYCHIKANQGNYLGILPVRTQTGIVFPVGTWSGMYFSEELKFAKENGYEISVEWGYKFDRVSNVFGNYVEKLYTMKSTPKNITQKNLAKSLLNNLLGRFGMDINKPITKIVNNETFNEISLTRKVTSRKDITDEDILLTYSAELDQLICESFDIDYLKALKDPKISSKQYHTNGKFKGVSIPIAAAVTAYGRIHITKIKKQILQMGGNIYYSDTDSVVTDIKLPASMVDPKAIGKLKLEHHIKRGYFISAKTYCLINDNGVEIKKAKGLNSNTLSEDDYVEMYKGKDIKTGIKPYSTTNYLEGSVIISEKEITLNADSYTKRVKVYKDNTWVDTEPLTYNNIKESCVTD